MEPTPREKEAYATMSTMFESWQNEVKENDKLKKEIAYLRAQLEEKEARIMEAKCGTK